MTEVVCPSETSANFCETTRRNIPEGCNFRENNSSCHVSSFDLATAVLMFDTLKVSFLGQHFSHNGSEQKWMCVVYDSIEVNTGLNNERNSLKRNNWLKRSYMGQGSCNLNLRVWNLPCKYRNVALQFCTWIAVHNCGKDIWFYILSSQLSVWLHALPVTPVFHTVEVMFGV
jgi:hypothetical protein